MLPYDWRFSAGTADAPDRYLINMAKKERGGADRQTRGRELQTSTPDSFYAASPPDASNLYHCAFLSLQAKANATASHSKALRRVFGAHDGNFVHRIRHFFAEATTPDITREKHLDGGG